MPTFHLSSSPSNHDEQQQQQEKPNLDLLLETARPFLRGNLELVDPSLLGIISELRDAGAGECWHKHGDFLSHLLGVHRVLRLWGAPKPVALCGLFHSAYSNSYVNLAIFDLSAASRARVASLVGPAAERLIHLFCIVPRQTMIHDDLLFKYSEPELTEHLQHSQLSIKNLRDKAESDPTEAWRSKLNSVVPADGIVVTDIRTKKAMHVPRRVVATFLLITMADFADQLFGWWDQLFGNRDGRLVDYSDPDPATLWPGNDRPGLWMNSVSRMSVLYHLIVREEELYIAERTRALHGSGNYLSDAVADRDEDLELVIPPVFDSCTCIVDALHQNEAVDMYWEAITGGEKRGRGGEAIAEAEKLLVGSIERNKFVGEPRLVLSQVYLTQGRYEEAEVQAEQGLRLLLQWGCQWDKRIGWEGWIAWGRVLLSKAKERVWPASLWGVLNLGLVR